MTTRGSLCFVNRFYWPDEPATAQLLTDLAEALAAKGWSVRVITSMPNHFKSPSTEERNGVEIHRIPARRFKGSGLILKALSFLSFTRSALREIEARLQPGDVLVMMTDPPLLGMFATGLARRRGARLVHWVQDIYPEIAIKVGAARFLGIFRGKRDQSWKQADACVLPGQDMAAFVHAHGVSPERILVSPNWAPAGLSVQPAGAADMLRREWGLVGKFVIMYSGNLGRVHDLHPVLAMAENLKAERDIVFLFVGNGAQRARLQATAARRGLKNVIFKPAQPRLRLATTLALADIHLVTLLTGCQQLVFPSKLYGIAAVGRPVLSIGPKQSELAKIIEGRGFGRAFTRHDTAACVQTILHLRHAPSDCLRMGKSAAAYAQETGGLAAAVSSWDQLLTRLMSLAPGVTPEQK